MNVEQLTCPLCGGHTKWSCSAGVGGRGSVECENGTTVSRRSAPLRPLCQWAGSPVQRDRRGVVVTVGHLLTDTWEEREAKRALAAEQARAVKWTVK